MMRTLFMLTAAVCAAACAEVKPWHTRSETTPSLRALIPAVPDASWTTNWWMGRHEAKMKEVRAGGAPIVFLGDSITHFWESNGRAVWDRYFASGKYRALNLGFSGDRTEHVLWRIAHGELDGYNAKAIVLMLGTNNSGHFPVEKETPEDTIVGMKAVLMAIRDKQPQAKIILCAIFPRGRDANDACRRRNAAVNKELIKFIDGRNIFWVDFTDRFLAPDGFLSAGVMPDRLHPGAYGYEVWASEVLPYLDWALDPAPKGLMPNRFPAFIDKANFAAEGPETVIPQSAFPNGNWWGTRCAEKRAEIAAHTNGWYDMVFVGDSITHRWERPGGGGEKVWAELLKTYSILNLGYGGDRTEHVLWRLENGELEGYKTKLFMLMIGTNNGGRAEPVAEGVKRCVATLRRKHPEAKVLLLPISPRGATAKDHMRQRNDAVNRIIKGCADGKDVLWLDFNDRFLDKDGNMLPGLMFKDNLHPDHAGYLVWRDAVLPVFRQIVGK